MRQDSFPPANTPISNQHVTNHFYPFDTLPLFESHLHPKFAIYNAAKKLDDFSSDHYLQLLEDYPQLSSIQILYNAWKRRPKEDELDNPSFLPPQVDDNEDEDDDFEDDPHDFDYDDRPPSRQSRSKKGKAAASPTKSRPSHPTKRRAEASPTKSHASHPKKRKAPPSSTGPTRKALSTHNQEVGKAAWTRNCIRQWSKCDLSSPFSATSIFNHINGKHE